MAFLMLENPLVALVAKSYLLIAFNCKTSKTSKTSFDLIFYLVEKFGKDCLSMPRNNISWNPRVGYFNTRLNKRSEL